MFATLSASLETEAELQVLLGLLPESKGGAGLLALGLLSTDARCVLCASSANIALVYIYILYTSYVYMYIYYIYMYLVCV